jgi:N,N'-diacetylchitobiose non-reducing end deacetylase
MFLDSIVPKPDFSSARRILCIQPHYDDNDIGAGGTLARLGQLGAELIYLTVTDDRMGVVDLSLTDEQAGQILRRDQSAAGEIMGVKEHILLGYPDAGEYSYFALRSDLLKHLRRIQPDFVFAPDPWLAYEGHRDHIQTGLASVEAVLFAGSHKIPSSDPTVDVALPHSWGVQGVALYFTREPNEIVDVGATFDTKIRAVRCYEAQFNPDDMEMALFALGMKARQAANGSGFEFAEALRVLSPSALHCGI